MHLRNKVVSVGLDYGRVVKKLKDGRYLVLTTGLYFYSIDAPAVVGYTGYNVCVNGKTRRVRMTTLRKLKKRAARFHFENAHNTPDDYEYIQTV